MVIMVEKINRKILHKLNLPLHGGILMALALQQSIMLILPEIDHNVFNW